LYYYGGSGGGAGVAGNGTWGTLTFSNYSDASSGDTLNGTLNVVVYQTGGTMSGFSYIVWSGFVGYIDITGTLQYSGSTSGNITLDFLASVSGSSIALTGTALLAGTYYDINTGKSVAPPTPTVVFSPTPEYNYSPGSGGVSFILTSAGSTIYYTSDGTLPAAGAGTTFLYSAPVTSTSGTFYAIAMAYGVIAGVPSRISLVVYPSYG
jgi:hypothetical protein